MEQEYLNSVKKQFDYYKSVGEKTFNQLEEDEVQCRYFQRADKEDNK